MPITAKLRYLRIAPRKVRLVADLIRGKSVEEAQAILNFTIKKAAQPVLKVLNSAAANAKNKSQLQESNLYISKIIVDEGSKYKRWRARARGRTSAIQKKTSHITIVLGELQKKSKKVKGVKKVEITETVDKAEKTEKVARPKFRPEKEIKPKIEEGAKRIFRRKAF